jgi:branched-chain amino acid transport system ATP-binding protein
MLEVQGLSKSFGGLTAVSGLTFSLAPGEVVGLIGPNGAGKTTCINLISGLLEPTAGSIVLDGAALRGLPPRTIVRKGIARTFQNIRLLPELSILDNVRVGQSARVNTVAAWCASNRSASEQARSANALRLLEEMGLRDRAELPAGALAYGQQKRLELARALASEPRFLLMDEPAGGMNAADVTDLKRLVRRVRAQGLGVLLIEHNMPFVMDVCDRVVVLNFGQLLAQGTPDEIRANPEVIDAYLGKQ